MTKKKIEIGSISPLRDFNYVQDTVNGFICLAESKFSNAEVFNLSSDEQISIEDIADLIQRKLKTTVPLVSTAERSRPDRSEVLSLMGDSSYLRDNTTWKPEISLEKGIDKIIDYIKSHIKEYKTEGYII